MPNVTDEKTKAQRGQLTCPTSHDKHNYSSLIMLYTTYLIRFAICPGWSSVSCLVGIRRNHKFDFIFPQISMQNTDKVFIWHTLNGKQMQS